MSARQIILRNFQAPGDIVMLTAAVRDLVCAHPESVRVDVRTSCLALWEHNPYLQRLDEADPGVETIECEYPLIHMSNQLPYHFIHGFRAFLESRLGLQIPPRAFHGDIHLGAVERGWMSQVEETCGLGTRFWIINAGGKWDYTAKWWPAERFQRVVDGLRDRVLFAQIGALGHHHPPLRGVIDLRGKTDLRQLVRLVHHADGVLCPVTALMHLAAAVPWKHGRGLRPCVTIAGGREPPHWEAYPGHRYLDTIGALPCCAHGGCWKSRTRPLGDGDSKDRPENLCQDVVGDMQRCMSMITPERVIEAVLSYYEGGVLPQTDPGQLQEARQRHESAVTVAAAADIPIEA